MNALYELLDYSKDETFLTFLHKKDSLDTPLHYHPEIEIIYILEGHGTRIIGESIENFDKDDLVVIGSEVEHIWMNNKPHNHDINQKFEYIVLFIDSSLISQKLFNIPEFRGIKDLLINSNKCIHFNKKSAIELKESFIKIANGKGFAKFTDTIKLLDKMSQIKTSKYILKNFNNKFDNNDDRDRLVKCIDYISKNYQNKIKLETIADFSNLAPNSFCRYFKQRTSKTLSQYISEIRINRACYLLIHTNNLIEEIAFDCGFNTMPNFYTQFAKQKDMLPTDYRNKFKTN
ncbi:MAG: AraC family transcriptional regulator [Bacteroidota bacterium]